MWVLFLSFFIFLRVKCRFGHSAGSCHLLSIPAFIFCFSPEQKRSSSSSWRQCVSWGEAMKLFSPHSTTLRRYVLRRRAHVRRQICHYILTAVSKSDSAPQECFPGWFCIPADGIECRNSIVHRLQTVVEPHKWRRSPERKVACVTTGFGIKALMSDNLVWPQPVLIKYSGCLRTEWEVHDGVNPNSSSVLQHRSHRNGSTAVNVIFTPVNEILSVALSSISVRMRKTQNS